ncbi:unnamed protein product [Notodromas monacha]|uniref:Gustatory receptor n=1 Tax=Notodromas monacha TaxID=399045 RepID=A0A7R9BY23_9CRUS|nr:unnamed protein product [Notodromas monacha]CAG0922771.1 unnamed protein product [Notodromas monacha]
MLKFLTKSNRAELKRLTKPRQNNLRKGMDDSQSSSDDSSNESNTDSEDNGATSDATSHTKENHRQEIKPEIAFQLEPDPNPGKQGTITNNKTYKQGKDFVVEITDGVLSLFGQDSLKCLEAKWISEAAQSVTKAKFQFIQHDDLVALYPKFREKFPNLVEFHFQETCLDRLGQLNGLAAFQKMHSLYISKEGNSIVQHPQWKLYAIYRLGCRGLKTINGKPVEPEDVTLAAEAFTHLSQLVFSCQSRDKILQLYCQVSAVLEPCEDQKKPGEEKVASAADKMTLAESTSPDLLQEAIGREALSYQPLPATRETALLKRSRAMNFMQNDHLSISWKDFIEEIGMTDNSSSTWAIGGFLFYSVISIGFIVCLCATIYKGKSIEKLGRMELNFLADAKKFGCEIKPKAGMVSLYLVILGFHGVVIWFYVVNGSSEDEPFLVGISQVTAFMHLGVYPTFIILKSKTATDYLGFLKDRAKILLKSRSHHKEIHCECIGILGAYRNCFKYSKVMSKACGIPIAITCLELFVTVVISLYGVLELANSSLSRKRLLDLVFHLVMSMYEAFLLLQMHHFADKLCEMDSKMRFKIQGAFKYQGKEEYNIDKEGQCQKVLEKILVHKAPAISAAGFFWLSKTMLPGMLGLLSTFLIILVQFKMSEEEPTDASPTAMTYAGL